LPRRPDRQVTHEPLARARPLLDAEYPDNACSVEDVPPLHPGRPRELRQQPLPIRSRLFESSGRTVRLTRKVLHVPPATPLGCHHEAAEIIVFVSTNERLAQYPLALPRIPSAPSVERSALSRAARRQDITNGRPRRLQRGVRRPVEGADRTRECPERPTRFRMTRIAARQDKADEADGRPKERSASNHSIGRRRARLRAAARDRALAQTARLVEGARSRSENCASIPRCQIL